MPGAFSIAVSVSRVSTLCAVEVEPRLTTTKLSGLAFWPVKMLAPSRIASRETRTATAVVTPTTVTSEEPRRCATLRRPVVVSSIVCLSTVMGTPGALPLGERLGHLQLEAAPRGRGAAENRERDRET